jgi:DNA invertase Pin-like site-specific DNA recombinase
VFVVTKLDRLARSVWNFLEIYKRLEQKKVELRILNMGIDTRTPADRQILAVQLGIVIAAVYRILARQKAEAA